MNIGRRVLDIIRLFLQPLLVGVARQEVGEILFLAGASELLPLALTGYAEPHHLGTHALFMKLPQIPFAILLDDAGQRFKGIVEGGHLGESYMQVLQNIHSVRMEIFVKDVSAH